MRKTISFFGVMTALCFMFSVLCHKSLQATITLTSEYVNDITQDITLNVSLSPKDFILKESIDISVDHPDIKLSPWKADKEAVERYEATFKDTKKVFAGDFTLSLQATSNRPHTEIKNARLYISYYLGSQKRTVQDVLPLKTKKQAAAEHEMTIGKAPIIDTKEKVVVIKKKEPADTRPTTWSASLSRLVATTETFWIRILLVLLLGLLLSLTPCIYPMIPITLGILQTRGSTSVFYNFLQALVYITGIATTFALLGLMAAFTGQVFGSLMTNPFFIIVIALLLAYLGLSMFGLYDMYTPRFMRKGAGTGSAQKSLLSIFLFGVISGTVASPCLSPGLILLLSIVSTIGSKLLGFALLFSFGIGLGIPLLIIGTFSGSLNALPRAGMWMVEVKKIFGFMLFGMAFYFLNNILPWYLLLLSMTLFMLVAGIFYFYSIKKTDARATRVTKNTIGVICCVLAVLLAAKTYQAVFLSQEVVDTFWYTKAQQALHVAKRERKKLFIDIGAPFCSICKTIDKNLFQNAQVRAALNKFVTLKIDGSDKSDTAFESIRKRYKVVGFPTFLLIDAQTEELVTRWSGELYDVSAQDFIKQLKKY